MYSTVITEQWCTYNFWWSLVFWSTNTWHSSICLLEILFVLNLSRIRTQDEQNWLDVLTTLWVSTTCTRWVIRELFALPNLVPKKRRREEMSEIGLEDHVLLWSVLNFNCFQISLINVNFHLIACLISFDWNSFIIKFPNCCWIIDFCVYYRRFYHK